MAMLDIFGSGMLDAANKMMRQKKATDGRTNPNARPAKQGKNAKSKKQLQREADMEMQRQMQLDQQKFIQDNIFDRTGATRRTMSGQIERDVPQGMDYFKNTGADRPEVAARQASLDSQSLKNPNIWAQAKSDVNLARRKQAEPPLFPGPQNQMTPEQQLRQGGNGVEVFDNPLFSQSNPRTRLNTNTGPFVRSMDNPYGTARALFTPQAQPPASGPVQSLFAPQQTAQDLAPSGYPSSFYDLPKLPQSQPPQVMPAAPQQSPASVNPAAAFGVPSVQWSDLMPQENSPPLFDLFQTGPDGQESFDWTKLLNMFTPQPSADYSGFKMPPLGF